MKLTEQKSDRIKLCFSHVKRSLEVGNTGWYGGLITKKLLRTEASCLPALLSLAGGSHPQSRKMAAPLPETSPTFQAGMKTKAMRKTLVPADVPHPLV